MPDKLKLSSDPAKDVDQLIEALLEKEQPLSDIQAEVKNGLADRLKAEMDEAAFGDFLVPVAHIRTIHAQVCAKKKSNFVCAGLFEE